MSVEVPDPDVVGAQADAILVWCEQHPGYSTDELMEFYRSNGWLRKAS